MNRVEKRRQRKLTKKAAVRSPNQLSPSTQQAIYLALQHHNAGRISEAEDIYQQILREDPNHPVALHLLGVIAHQAGRNEVAVDLINKALSIMPNYAQAYSNLGTALKELGRVDEAVTSYHKALAIKPDYAEAHNNLGNALHELGKLDDAVASCQKAIAIKPDFAEAHNNLGNTFKELGKLDEAAASHYKALAIKPDFAEAHNNLGTALEDQGLLDEAVISYHKALAIKPDFAEAHTNLGNAFQELGKLDEAVTSYHKALAINPDYAKAHNNLGNAFQELGKLDQAVTSYHNALAISSDFAEAHNSLGNIFIKLGKLNEAVTSFHSALAIKPDLAEAHTNLGNALKELGKMDEAVTSYHKALAINPDYATAHNNLGTALQDQGLLDDAVISYHRALTIKSDFFEAHNSLGNIFMKLGKLDEAVASYYKALAVRPDYHASHSNLLLAQQYLLGQNTEKLYEMHKDWDQRHAQQFYTTRPCHLNTPDPNRVLRIGFSSPDLGWHPVGFFIVRLFESILENEIKTIVYSDRLADDLTNRIRAASGLWRNVNGISDENLSKIILDDEIDILFDLTGHSAKNRMLLFARKPAPIQVSWAGYVGTTGLSSMDYLLSDIHSTPEDEDKYYSEKVIRMPDGWLCYDPPDYAPEIGPLPFKQNGRVTFCSFSNPGKINQEVISVWAAIMNAVPNSCLLIKYSGIDTATNIERLTAMFAAKGINKSRLVLEGQSPHINLLARYNDVDIALDTFPYSGGLTTYEALWMGVPLITVPGDTFASRHSKSHLTTVGLPELIAKNTDDYIRLAVELAGNAERMAELRTGLRSWMANSPICDGEKFSDNFTAIMRKIWQDWCLTQDVKDPKQ